MDIDAQFPALSTLAHSHGITLNDLAKSGRADEDEYLRLPDCCYMVQKTKHRWVVDARNYLATFDEFIRRLPDDYSRKKIWRKVASRNSSEFLDTVVEAAWALEFWDNGNTPVLEQRFDPSNRDSKDADIVVVLDGVKHWLDAKNIQLSKTKFPVATADNPFVQTRSPQDIIRALAAKAKAEYQKKFGAAIQSGFFKNDALGILLCVLKSESQVLIPLVVDVPNSTPPEGLLGNKPGLNKVLIHTLRPHSNSDVLRPIVVADWHAV